jgi:hypothetical protein
MLSSLSTDEVNMSVAVSCNLSDGVVLGVDSAVTVPGPGGIVKVYENAEKLFQLGDRPIGVAFYGIGVLGTRTLGSFLREYEKKSEVLGSKSSLEEIVEDLRVYFIDVYRKSIVNEFEKTTGQKFDSIPEAQRPAFGLVVGGFSYGAFLSEVWNIIIPHHDTRDKLLKSRPQGEFGTNWFAMYGPIARYIKGYDPQLFSEVEKYFISIIGRPLSIDENKILKGIQAKHEYQIPFPAMPLEEGVEHTRFLVELVINHHRFAVGAPVVGGKAKIGKVTYKGGSFQFIV